MNNRMDLNNPSNNSLKAIFFIHFIFAAWGVQGSWSPDSYLFYNVFFFLLLLWALHSQESVDPVQMALCINILSILFDIIVLSVYYPSYIQTAGSDKFSAGMAIINLLLRPISSIGLYRILMERTNQGSSVFPANLCGNFFGAPLQRSPYEDIDRAHTMPAPAAPDALRTASSPSEKTFYNIVG